MGDKILADRLGKLADRLVGVAGELMRRACNDSWIHEESCTCPTCNAFVTTQDVITQLSAIEKEVANARGE